jgi:hypothetical protein
MPEVMVARLKMSHAASHATEWTLIPTVYIDETHISRMRGKANIMPPRTSKTSPQRLI